MYSGIGICLENLQVYAVIEVCPETLLVHALIGICLASLTDIYLGSILSTHRQKYVPEVYKSLNSYMLIEMCLNI